MTDIFDDIMDFGSKSFEYLTNTDDGLISDVGDIFQKSDGSIDFGKVAGGIGALGKVLADTGVIGADTYLGKLFGGPQTEKLGYQGKIPDYTATRTRVPGTYDPERRPGSGGQRYFTDVAFSGGERGTQDTSSQAAGLQAMNLANLAQQNRQGEGLAALRAKREADAANSILAQADQLAQEEQIAQTTPAATQPIPTVPTAESLLTEEERANFGLARGGIARLNRGMYLGGATDGMADRVPAMIGNTQPAALSDGEFVIPADVVSGLGNGNSDAGAKNLYAMMDRVRKARTGTTKQAPAINPNRMMPTMRG